jgi:hypothetical protein
VRNWLASFGLAAVPQKFEECLLAAFLSDTDAYRIARNTELHFKWPANAELVALLSEALSRRQARRIRCASRNGSSKLGPPLPGQAEGKGRPSKRLTSCITGIVTNVQRRHRRGRGGALHRPLAQRTNHTPMRRLKAEDILDLESEQADAA